MNNNDENRTLPGTQPEDSQTAPGTDAVHPPEGEAAAAGSQPTATDGQAAAADNKPMADSREAGPPPAPPKPSPKPWPLRNDALPNPAAQAAYTQAYGGPPPQRPAEAGTPYAPAGAPYTPTGAPQGGWAGASYYNGGPPPPPPAGGGTEWVDPAPGAKRKKRNIAVIIIACVLALVLLIAFVGSVFSRALNSLEGLTGTGSYEATPPAGSFSVISVIGEIGDYAPDALGINQPSYYHSATVNHIRELVNDSGNRGILLYLNTPGGGVYESDELYAALRDYKEKTGRPVWAYMAQMCASGGYYACAAADNIVANRSTLTGSIGVYMSMTDTSGLYEMLGIRSILIASGSNKGVGTSGIEITDDQVAVYQGLVDEMYERFVGFVAEGRGMSYDAAAKLADGRAYTAKQAKEAGLIDEIGEWDPVVEQFMEETGASPYYVDFSYTTFLGSLLSSLPQSETELLLREAENAPSGVPMSCYPIPTA